MTVRIEHGDMREVLARLIAEGVTVQSVVCDPPYHLTNNTGSRSPNPGQYTPIGKPKQPKGGFMGKQWDGGDIAFQPETWRLCWELLPPGGHLLAFSGTRTYHRMACAIEDAGFEIRDTIAWLYGSGFPKSHNVGKKLDEWEGWGTALKPALEPICLARKPLDGTVAANVLKHGTGALNIDGCRIGATCAKCGGSGRLSHVPQARCDACHGSGGEDLNGGRYSDNKQGDDRNTYGSGINRRSKFDYAQPSGRWPANVAHDGSEEVVAAFPDGHAGGNHVKSNGATRQVFGHYNKHLSVGIADTGSAARFFYSAKADADDRLGSKHPTVKPVDLMRWLVRLITPPGGLVLDPFAGSGTTGMACMAEGLDCLLVEREAEYVADIRRRIAHVHGADTPLFSEPQAPDHAPLFAKAAAE